MDKLANHVEPSGYLRTRYSDPEIKSSLIKETHAKCAYCESKFLHIAYGDVEHVIPKSVRPDLSFEWTNLTLACDRCNTNKGAYTGEHDRILDPYATEPSSHMNIFGPLIFAKPGDGDGKITVMELDLNRTPLVERRTERLKRLSELVEIMATTTDHDLHETLRRDIERNELTDDKEYAAFGRKFYAQAQTHQ